MKSSGEIGRKIRGSKFPTKEMWLVVREERVRHIRWGMTAVVIKGLKPPDSRNSSTDWWPIRGSTIQIIIKRSTTLTATKTITE